MSDDNGHKPSRVIPIRDRQDPAGKRMSSYEIKQEIIAGVAAASLAVGQKVYEQATARTSELLAEMEERLRAEFGAPPPQSYGPGILSMLTDEPYAALPPTDSEGPE